MPRALRLGRAVRPLPRAQARAARGRAAARLGRACTRGLGITKRFYDRFMPAIDARDFALRPRQRARPARRAGPRRRAARMSARDGEGELAIVLHSHMPYVEGFGTWPFGEEWLWEAIATSYLPLLELLDAGAPLTLSLTPVLCDQLEAPGALERCAAFLAGDPRRVAPPRHRERGRRAGVVAALEHSAARYEWARERLAQRGWRPARRARPPRRLDVVGDARDPAAARHRRRRAPAAARGHRRAPPPLRRGWRGGLWLPECAYAPWLDGAARGGRRARRLRRPHRRARRRRAPAPAALARRPAARADRPRDDRARLEPRRLPGRRRAIATTTRSRSTATARGATTARPTTRRARAAAAREHAADFVARVRERVARRRAARSARSTPSCSATGGTRGRCGWRPSLDEAARQGLRDRAPRRRADAPRARRRRRAGLPVTSWGTPRDLTTWSAPPVAAMAWSARDAELRTVAAARAGAADARAVRELLALQSSDWAFLVSPRPRRALRARARRAATARRSTPRSPRRARSTRACATSRRDASPAALLEP